LKRPRATEGDLHLPRCRFHNGVRLTDAHIGTDLLLNPGRGLPRRRGRSITGDGMTVGQDLQAEMLESHGELSLRAHRRVSLSLRGSRLTNPYTRLALNAPQLTVNRTLYMTRRPSAIPSDRADHPGARHGVQRFECQGGIRLDDGRFGTRSTWNGPLHLRRRAGAVTAPGPDARAAFPRGEAGARQGGAVGREGGQPGRQGGELAGPGGLHMGGFGYENLVPQGAFPLARRWSGAAATAEYNPEPYERLATVLRNSGEDEEPRGTARKQRAAARHCRSPPSSGGTRRT